MDSQTRTPGNPHVDARPPGHGIPSGVARLKWMVLLGLVLALCGLAVPARATQTPVPEVIPNSGTYSSPLLVTMNDPTSGSLLCYTLNNADFAPDTTLSYSGPFKVSGEPGSTVTVWGRATDPGCGASDITVRTYTFRATSTTPATYAVDGVNTAGPWDGSEAHPYRTIQSAIFASKSSDTVVVRPGTYRENIKFLNKNIVVCSQNPKSPHCVQSTVIDGGARGPVVEFGGNESSSCMVTGLTITGGLAANDGIGGGIAGHGTKAGICNNVISGNQALYQSEAVYHLSSHGSVETVLKVISLKAYGGGLANCDGMIENNIIVGNVAGTPDLPSTTPQDGSDVTSIMLSADFHGAALYNCNGTILNNTIWDNACHPSVSISNPDTAMNRSVLSGCLATIVNTIVWGNDAVVGLEGCAAPRYCDIQGSALGISVISADPLFSDPFHGDFHLLAASPCIDAGCYATGAETDYEGHPRGVVTIAAGRGDGSHYDIGASEYVVADTVDPVVAPGSGTYPMPLTVTMSCPTSNTTIRYTIYDGVTSSPLGAETNYTTPLTLTGSPGQSFKVVATAASSNPGYEPSQPVTRSYTLINHTIYVDGSSSSTLTPNGTPEHPFKKIQDAIDVAVDTMEIVVMPGTYRENINYKGKSLALHSRDVTSWSVICSTIIDGGANGSVVTFAGTESPNYRLSLSGFTITNGLSAMGGGINGAHARPTIRNNRIINNKTLHVDAYSFLYSIHSFHGIPIMEQGTEYDCFGRGGGIAQCDGLIQNNIIASNTAGGSERPPDMEPAIVCIAHYEGAALYDCAGVIQFNTIWGNTSIDGVLNKCSGLIRNNIIWGNTITTWSYSLDRALIDCSTPQYCDIQGWTGGGTANLSADPLLTDPAHGDFGLQAASPCIDAAASAAGLDDMIGMPRPQIVSSGARGDGSHYDIGAFERIAPVLPAPAIDPASGVYASPLRVTLSDAQSGVTIRYTLDGSDPTTEEVLYSSVKNETDYNAPFLLTHAPGSMVTVKARALQPGYQPSAVTVRSYTIPVPRRLFVDDDARAGGDGGWQAPLRTIQDAINAAYSGDTVIVAPGIYRENIDFHQKNIVLQSRDPHSWATILKTVIDGGAKGPAVSFGGTERGNCILTGFTITNGQSASGAGITGNGTYATIQNNYIVNNTGFGVVGVSVSSHPSAANPGRTVYEVTRTVRGQGAGLAYCQGPIQNNVIAYNRCQTLQTPPPAGATSLDTVIYHDTPDYWGSALYLCLGPIRNNTIWGNSGGQSVVASCRGSFGDNIVWANFPGAYWDSAASTYCVIQDWKGGGTGNRTTDPLLLDPLRDDYHLRSGSSAIDGGVMGAMGQDLEGHAHGYVGTSGIQGSRYDIGAFECAIAPPELTPDGGTALTLPLTVAIRCATAGTTIRTTQDGSEPTAASPLYTAPLALKGAPGAALTLKARAFKTGLPDSPVTARTFAFAPIVITQISRTGVELDKLAATKMVYVGRSLRFVDPIPAALKGQWYLRTLYADKDSNAALGFTINQPATVVVAVSAGLTTLPGWLKGWTRLSEQLKTNDTVPGRVLYKKGFAAGRITLGANREGERSTGQNPYSVIVTP